MAHDVDELAGGGLRVARLRHFASSRRKTRAVRPAVLPPAREASRSPRITWRWKMLPLRIASGSSNGRSTSASSIAGPSAAMAAAAAARSPPPARSRPMWTAISGSATGLIQPASEALPPDRDERPLHQEADQRRRDLEFLHHRRRAETDLPAERRSPAAILRPPLRQLLRHAALDARIVPGCAHVSASPSRLPAPRSRTPRSSRRPSSPTPAPRPRRTCC